MYCCINNEVFYLLVLIRKGLIMFSFSTWKDVEASVACVSSINFCSHRKIMLIVKSFVVCLLLAPFVYTLPPLCPPPPYEDDVHLSCATESGFFSSIKTDCERFPVTSLNIVEYNIDRNGYGGDGSAENGLQPIIDLLQNSSLVPSGDIFLMSEVARGCPSWGGVDFSGAQEIAKAMNLNYYYAVEYVDIDQSDETNECSIGNAILSKYVISNITQLRFESQCCRYGGRYGGRIDLIGTIDPCGAGEIALGRGEFSAQFSTINNNNNNKGTSIATATTTSAGAGAGGLRIHVHSTHLESGQSNLEMVLQSIAVREQQAGEMTAVTFADTGSSACTSSTRASAKNAINGTGTLGAGACPVVIGGDLNSPFPKIDPTVLRLQRDGYTNVYENFTLPEREPFQLDYLFYAIGIPTSAGTDTGAGAGTTGSDTGAGTGVVEVINPGWCSDAGCVGYSDHVPYFATIQLTSN
jgi:hypothetical protein